MCDRQKMMNSVSLLCPRKEERKGEEKRKEGKEERREGG